METVYLVMREKGIHTDGKTYYEAESTICGIRASRKEASNLMKKVVKKFHPEETAIRGIYDSEMKIDTAYVFRMDEGLEDSFWIKTMTIGPEGDEY